MLSKILISQSNLVHNFNSFRQILDSKVKIACVIKGNAYGHGQNEVAKILEPYADYFQVDDLQELKKLREVSDKPTFVFGYVAVDELEIAIRLNGILTIYDLKRLEIINQLGQKLNTKPKVHIKVDAHLGRQGILPDEVENFVSKLNLFKNIEIDGVYAHFANIEDTQDFSHAQKQIDTYNEIKEIFRKYGFNNIKTHISSTAGTLVYEKNKLNTNKSYNYELGNNDIIRLGIGLYGMWPSRYLMLRFIPEGFLLKPIIKWVSRIAQIKVVKPPFTIGYGLTHTIQRETKVAIIPQGYSDGFDRGLSGIGEVLIHGSKCKILGRIAMNMFVVDISHLENVDVEDEVVLLGEQNNEKIMAENIADKIGTINYEVTTRISALLDRVVVE